MELQRQMGFGSYGTAWAWLHKIRNAMVRPGRKPLAAPGRGRRDAARRRPARQARPRRGRQDGGGRCGRERRAARVAGRRLGRLRLQAVPDASANEPRRLSRQPTSLRRPRSPPTAGRAIAGSMPPATPTSRSISPRLGRRRARACRRSTSSSASPSAGSWAPTMARSGQAPAGLSRRVRLPLQPPHRQQHRPPLRPPHRAGRPHPTDHLPRHRRRNGSQPEGHGELVNSSGI